MRAVADRFGPMPRTTYDCFPRLRTMSAQNLNPAELLPHQGRKTIEHASTEETRSLYQRGRDSVVQAEQKFEHYVSANPVKSVLIAAGVGVAVGLLIGRRR